MRRTPLRPSLKPIPRRTRPRAKGGKRFPKGYNKAYREDVAGLRCILFGKTGHDCGSSEPAHIVADATGEGDVGKILPMCANAHRLGKKNWHSTGRHSFCAYWGLGSFEDLERMAQELAVNLGYA